MLAQGAVLGTPWAPGWMCAHTTGATRTWARSARTVGQEQGVLAPSYQDATRPWALIPIPQWAHGVPSALAQPRAAPYSPRDLSCCTRAPRCQAAAPHASHTRKPQGNPQGLSDVFAHRVSADGRNFHIGSDIWLRETRSSLISLCVFPYCTKPALSVAPGSAVPRPSAALLRRGLSAGMSEPWGPWGQFASLWVLGVKQSPVFSTSSEGRPSPCPSPRRAAGTLQLSPWPGRGPQLQGADEEAL